MANDAIDTYQLASLIELTNSMAENSIHSSLDTEQLVHQSIDNLMWIINFDVCLIIEKSHDTLINVISTNGKSDLNFDYLAQLPITEFKKNMAAPLSGEEYHLFYNILHKKNNDTKLIVFLQHGEPFSSQNLIILELFCASVKRLIETKENESENRRLQNDKLILEESNKLKSMFLSTISHEIRTPMNGILGTVQLFKDTTLNEQQQEMLDTITTSSQQFSKILDDILDFSQLETSQAALSEVDFNFKQTIEKLSQQFINEISEKGINLTITIDPELPKVFLGDIAKISKIITCLMCNAVKFTPTGDIEVSVNGQKSIANIYLIDISIKDTGSGISEKQQKVLFQPFTQADSSMSRKHGGMGLGLAISNKLATALNGKLKVDTQEGVGSTFTLSIPLSSSTNDDLGSHQQEREKQPAPTINEEHKVLVVEDVRINQTIAKKMLAKLGLDCDIADNGIKALEAVEQSQYSIIFMDLQMPEMDGLAATQAIVERYGANRPYIVAMTANVSQQDKDNCEAVGMDDFVAKPIDITELERTLSTNYSR